MPVFRRLPTWLPCKSLRSTLLIGLLALGGVPRLNAALPLVSLVSPSASTIGVLVNSSGISFQFNVSSDSAYTEKWYKEGVEITASTKYEITAGRLRVTNIEFSDDGHYQLKVTNETGTTNSVIIWLRVLDTPPDPVITTQPISADLAFGATYLLRVQLAASGAYAYRWYKDGLPIANAISSTFRILSATKADAGGYHVVISTPTTSVTSETATITVADPVPPAIKHTLPDLALNSGESTYIPVNVTGSGPLTFRLLRNDALLLEQTSPSFYLFQVSPGTHNGTYRVEATSAYGSAVSNNFTITVAPPVPPSISLGTATPVQMDFGGYLNFSANVTGSSPMTLQWYKDGVPLKEGTSSYLSISNLSEDHSGTYRLTATNAGGTVDSPGIVVTIRPPVAPTITSYVNSSNVVAYAGSSFSLGYANITGSGPLTYKWYKDGQALSSTGSYFSHYPTTVDDAGSYWLEVSSPYGIAIGDPFAVVVVSDNQNSAKVLRAEHNGIVYVVAPNSALLRRYDLASQTWLETVSLGYVPAALAVDAHGVFIGHARALQRFSLAIDNETNVRNFTSDIREILAGKNHLFVASGDYAHPQIDSLDYTDFSVKGTFTAIYSLAQNLTLNADNTLITGRDMGISPSDIYRLVINPDGTFGSILSSPYHGSFAQGNRLYFIEEGARIAENTGVVYASDTLVFTSSVGGAFSDLVETGPGQVVVARGHKLYTYDDGVPGSQYALAAVASFLVREGTHLFAFALDATAPNGLRVEKVAIADIDSEEPLTPVVTPTGRAFKPAAVEYLDDFLYLYDRTAGNVHVFDTAAFGYTASIPLRGRPSFFRLEPTSGSMFTAYSDGSIWRLNAASALKETPLTVLPFAPRALQPAGDVVFASDSAGSWSTIYTLDATTGNRLSSAQWSHQDSDYLWNETRARLYSINPYGYGLHYIEINPDGTFGTMNNYSSTTPAPPLRMNPSNSLLLTGAGTMVDAVTLAPAGAIGNTFTDGVWTNGVITTIRLLNGGTQIQQWNPSTYTLTRTATLSGTPLRIFARDDGGFLLLQMHAGVPAPTLLDSSLAVVTTLVPLTQSAVERHLDSIVPLGTNVTLDALPQLAAPGATFVWSHNGAVILGATSRTLALGTLEASEVGLYSVAVTFLGTTLTTNQFWVGPTPDRSHLINVSTRSYTEAGAKTLIMGFSLVGTGNKPLLTRTSGPALKDLGVSGVLENPLLRVFSGQTEILSNDNWQDPSDYLAVGRRALELGAFSFRNLSLDAALLTTYTPGNYTIHAGSSIADSTGVVLAEIYDANDDRERLASPRIRNFSGRTEVRTGDDVLILGFIIAGNTSKRLLIRGIGPTLSQLDVEGPLPDPTIGIYSGQTLINENDNWGGTAELTQAFLDSGAFALDPASLDAALLVTLNPGSYTAVVRGQGNTTGVALAELYDLD